MMLRLVPRWLAKRLATLSAEQDGGHAQPGRLGHEGEAVLRRHRDQSVGRRLLRPAEAVQRRPAQVSRPLVVGQKSTGPDIRLEKWGSSYIRVYTLYPFMTLDGARYH